jgi:hypothetical protein
MTMATIEAKASELVTDTEKVSVLFQVDDEDDTETWHDLATITARGQHELRLGANGEFPTNQSPKTRYDGVGFSRMRYRIRLERDPTNLNVTPELKALVMVFIKRMRRLQAFGVQIDCSTDEHDGAFGLGNDERRKVLAALIDNEAFVPIMYRDFWVMVKITSVNGLQGTGNDDKGDVFFNFLQAWETPAGALV